MAALDTIVIYEVEVTSPTVPAVQHKVLPIVATTVELNQSPYPTYAGMLINPHHIQWDDLFNPGRKAHALFPLDNLYPGQNYTTRVRAVNLAGVSGAWSAPSAPFAKDPAYGTPAPPPVPPTITGVELFP